MREKKKNLDCAGRLMMTSGQAAAMPNYKSATHVFGARAAVSRVGYNCFKKA